MIINILGVMGIESNGNDLTIESEQSRITVSQNEFRLEPATKDYTKFALGDTKVTCRYSDGDLYISGPTGEWKSNQVFLGGNLSYAFFTEQSDQKLYVAREWDGSTIFEIPYFHANNFFGSFAIALGNADKWFIYNLSGQCVQEITCCGMHSRIGRAHFTDQLFFFRQDTTANYQIYDVKNQAITTSIQVSGAIFSVLLLPDGATLVIDSEGIKRLECAHASTKLETLHYFSLPLDTSQTDVTTWHDTTRSFIAINLDERRQFLFALPLQNEAKLEELTWSENWTITKSGGYLAGWNYLTLKRKTLLSDNAAMLWRADQKLEAQLLEYDLSGSVKLSRAASNKKGKHGYALTIEDTSANRAVRTAALELGRLLSETCHGVYNDPEGITDRKFDGQFYIEIITPFPPDDFEQAYLPEYIKYFRYFGGLSPAGSKAVLADPIMSWVNSQ
nr:hypothetical protein [uncultured Pseudomonas sp.]